MVFELPRFLVKDLLSYCVFHINVRRTKALSRNLSPRMRFTGWKVNYKRELALGFGDYVEAKDPKVVSQGSRSSTETCIAFYPAINFTGEWMIFNVETKKRVRRGNYKLVKETNLIKAQMNALSGIGEVVPV